VDDSAAVSPLSDANDSNRSPLSHYPKQVLVSSDSLPTVFESYFLAPYFIPLVFYRQQNSTNNFFLCLLVKKGPCPCEMTSNQRKTSVKKSYFLKAHS